MRRLTVLDLPEHALQYRPGGRLPTAEEINGGMYLCVSAEYLHEPYLMWRVIRPRAPVYDWTWWNGTPDEPDHLWRGIVYGLLAAGLFWSVVFVVLSLGRRIA